MSNDNTFEIPVDQNSQQISLQAELIPFGYSYKIDVDVFGRTIAFERDEEQNFRAVLNFILKSNKFMYLKNNYVNLIIFIREEKEERAAIY
jgi:hypothetical protein